MIRIAYAVIHWSKSVIQNMTSMNKIILCTLVALTLVSCDRGKVKLLEGQVSQLETQIAHSQETNNSLLDRLSDLSVINQTEAKSIQSSLESLGKQNEYIQDLTSKIHEKDSINFALVSNLKRSLIDVNDEDIQVEVRGSAVYISIADELLFQTASARISRKANVVLQKVATVINDHDNVNVLVEGHTDNVPIHNDQFKDNWDLSVQRAAAVIRILHNEYNLDPARLTAAGRSYYIPRADNDTPQGRAKNRRTEIILTPKLDQFFRLLEAPELVG